MFERFVLPDLSACCETLDYAFYHLDGKGQLPHLDMLLAMEHLRGIQWVPGDGQPQAEHWLPLLNRIRQSGKLCQVYVSAQGALTILRELGGKGLALVINEVLTPEQGQALLDEITQIGKSPVIGVYSHLHANIFLDVQDKDSSFVCARTFGAGAILLNDLHCPVYFFFLQTN